jgi:hypothetical protein
MGAPSNWHEEQINTLTSRWLEGDTAAIIGAVLKKSRNAVIGKVHRLGLKRAGDVGLKPRPPRPRRKPTASEATRVAPMDIVPLPPIEGGVSLIDLEHHHCRAIVGAGPDGLARYCGGSKEGWIAIKDRPVLSAYCQKHGNLYYRRD